MRDDCWTADDVRRRAAEVIAKRKAQRPPIDRHAAERALAALMAEKIVVQPLTETSSPEENKIGEQAKRIAVALAEEGATYPSLGALRAIVCTAYDITREDFVSLRRSPFYTVPRHAFFILAHCLTPKSLPELSRKAGGRHHTTALYGIVKYKWLIDILKTELKKTDPLETWVKRTVQLIGPR